MSAYLALWLIIGGVALIVDVMTSSFLFVWFTVGAITAIIFQILNQPFIIQLIAFVATSAISMAVCYPIVKKNIKKSIKPTLVREKTYIGRELTVDDRMIESSTVKIDGVYWNMINEGEKIKIGDRVKIVGMKGNKIIIKNSEKER